MGYIKAMRPVMGVFSSLLCWASLNALDPTFVHQHLFRAICLSLAVFLGTCANMVWNDFRDREHDLKKGKSHAFDRWYEYASLSRYLYMGCAFLAAWACEDNLVLLYVVIFSLCVVGIYYDRTYQRFPAPLILVSAVSASPILMALFLTGSSKWAMGLGLFLSATLIVGARETIKDVEDMEIDHGYKKTVPTVLGRSKATKASALLLVLGAIVLFATVPVGPLIWVSGWLIASAVMIVSIAHPEKLGKIAIDGAMGTFLVMMLLST